MNETPLPFPPAPRRAAQLAADARDAYEAARIAILTGDPDACRVARERYERAFAAIQRTER